MNLATIGWPSGADTGWPSEPRNMLPGRVEGFPQGTQAAANDAERLLTQAVAYWDASQFRNGDRFLRNRGVAGDLLDLRLGSSITPNSNDPLYLAPEDQGYVYLPGTTLNYLNAPDENALDITGDIDIRVCVAMDDWTPSASSALLSKYDSSVGGSYLLRVNTTGTLGLFWNQSTVLRSAISSAPTVVDGNVLWVRAALDVDNGAGTPQYEVRFYTSPDGSTWTQLGSTVTGTTGVTSIDVSAFAVNIGRTANDQQLSAGKFYRAVIYSDLTETNKVLDIDCDAITSGSATSFTAVTNQTVTINRSTGDTRRSVAMPSRSKGGHPTFLFGADDYAEIQGNWQHGLLNFGQGDSFSVLMVNRVHLAAGGRIWINKINGFSGETGWRLGTDFSQRFGTWLADGNNANRLYPSTNPQYPLNSLGVMTLTVDRNHQILTPYVGSVAGTSVSTSSLGSLVNLSPIRIGVASWAVSNPASMEFYAAAIFRRALTSGEITTLSNYFAGRVA